MLDVLNFSVKRGNFQTPEVSFSLNKGECIIVKGKNGSGKTSLLLGIIGYISPNAGKVFFNNTDVHSLSTFDRAKIFSILQQIPPASSYLTTEDVIKTGINNRKPITTFMEIWKIEHLSGRIYSTLSGGERKLVLLARIWARETPVIILDEPDAFLDEDNRTLLVQNINASMKRGTSFIITTHDKWLTENIKHREIAL